MSSMESDPLGYLIKRAQAALRHAMDAALSPLGLSTPRYAALLALRNDPGVSNAELARRCFVAPQTMHRILAELESDGLVERRPHPSHGRILQLALTPRGVRAVDAAERRVDAIEARMLAGLSAAQVVSAAAVLERCAVALEPSAG